MEYQSVLAPSTAAAAMTSWVWWFGSREKARKWLRAFLKYRGHRLLALVIAGAALALSRALRRRCLVDGPEKKRAALPVGAPANGLQQAAKEMLAHHHQAKVEADVAAATAAAAAAAATAAQRPLQRWRAALQRLASSLRCRRRAPVDIGVIAAPPPAGDENVDEEVVPVDLKSHPDFSGQWVVSEVTGDWNGFARELGFPWSFRQVFKSYRWGVGRAVEIWQDGDALAIGQPKTTKKVHFTIGAGFQKVDIGLGPYEVSMWWGEDGCTLEQDVWTESQTKRLALRKTFFQDGDKGMPKLTEEYISPSGISATRIYERA
mmetsp:Transcript_32202/g.68509  ORF Transcript_32202/g.68509 Transcript_32202/m.68509 type:complete len:319 (-) Transcript_32202:109-1065(-)